jgi:WD40 repeat protein
MVLDIHLIPSGTVATGSLDKTVRCWDLETRQCVNILKSERFVIIHNLYEGSSRNLILVWDLLTL